MPDEKWYNKALDQYEGKCGFVAHKGLRGTKPWTVTPGSVRGGKIICHDLSGFLGSWEAHTGAEFYPCPDGDALNSEVMGEVQRRVNELNVNRCDCRGCELEGLGYPGYQPCAKHKLSPPPREK